MPTKWELVDGLYQPTGLRAQEDAAEMGGRVRVDPATFQISTDWNGGSDPVTITPTWAGQISNVQEIPQGWQGRIANNNVVQLLDLQGTKFGDHLGEFLGNGPKILQWLPVNQILDRGDGWWVAEEFILGGAWDNFDWLTQDPATFIEGSTYGPNVPYSIAPYHKTKRNNQTGGDSFRVGKKDQWNNPLAIFWDGFKTGYKGHVVGRLAKVGDRVFKIFPMAEMTPYITASNFVSVDATLGYTTAGSLVFPSNYEQVYSWMGDMPVDGTLTDFNVYGKVILAPSAIAGVYRGTSNIPDPLVAADNTPQVATSVAWYSYTLASEAVSSGDQLWGMWAGYNDSSNRTQPNYDSGFALLGFGFAHSMISGPAITVCPDPATLDSVLNNQNLRTSMYVTYTEAAGGAIPQIMHHRQQQGSA